MAWTIKVLSLSLGVLKSSSRFRYFSGFDTARANLHAAYTALRQLNAD